MSLEYYMFLEEIRMITISLKKLQESTDKRVMKSIFFMEDLKAQIEGFDKLLIRGLQK